MRVEATWGEDEVEVEIELDHDQVKKAQIEYLKSTYNMDEDNAYSLWCDCDSISEWLDEEEIGQEFLKELFEDEIEEKYKRYKENQKEQRDLEQWYDHDRHL